MHTDQHPLADRTIQLPDDRPIMHNLLGNVAGEQAIVEDWWDRVSGGSWTDANDNPAALVYAVRTAFAQLPLDDEVVYVKVNHLGMLLHESELT